MKQLGKFFFDTIGTVLLAVILAFLIARFVGQVTIVQGASMEPTLQSKQRLIVGKLAYLFVKPAWGDIVLVQLPDMNDLLIKRVVATAGQTIEIRDNRLLIDGIVMDEPYLGTKEQADVAKLTIPAEHVYVMGDNRGNSRDSRQFGTVPVDDLAGIARLSIWPINKIGMIK